MDDDRKYLVGGVGKHQDGLEPYLCLLGSPNFQTLTEARNDAEWHNKNNPYAVWKVYKVEEVM